VTTRVLVLSDTHLRRGADLPGAVLELADRADEVVHAGDLVDVDVLDVLEALAPVHAVAGNCDGHDVAARLGETLEVVLDGVPFAVVHDPGPSGGRHERLERRFAGARVIAYGHTHAPEVAWTSAGTLVVNPGSPTQRRRAPTHTVAWLELADGAVRDASLVHLD
jgi:putative phosphoesterase